MNKVSGLPKNDQAIFAAMTSLVKAQAYELSFLPGPKADLRTTAATSRLRNSGRP